MKLTKEQKDIFFEEYDNGDLCALEYLYSLLREENGGILEETEELAWSVLRLNYMNDIIETQGWEHFLKYEKQISDLYFDMKRELTDLVGITDEDWKHYTGC